MIFNVKTLLGMDKSSATEPLGNRKNALNWLNELPNNDITGAQRLIVDALKQLTEAKTTAKEETNRLEIIDALDQHVQALNDQLCDQYLRSPRMSQSVENRLWNAIYTYYIVISQVYFYHLQALSANQNLRTPDSSTMPKLALRGLYNLGNAFKWRFIRYNIADPEMWGMLNALYHLAEVNGFAQYSGTVYTPQIYRCGSLFLRTQLLALLHPGALQPDQIEQLDHWLITATEPMALEKSPKPSRHHYFVDLMETHGALPVSPSEYSQHCRGWDMSTLLIQLQRSKSELIQSKTQAVQRQKVLSAFEYAEKQWYPGHLGKLRKTPRLKSGRQLEAVHGLQSLCNVVKCSMEKTRLHPHMEDIKYNETIDLQMYGFVTENTRARQQQVRAPTAAPEHTEQWDTENESATGYLVRHPVARNNWLHLGSLIGVREKNNPEWQVCVARRMLKTQQMTSLAGVEIIAQHPFVLLLTPIEPEHSVTPPVGQLPNHSAFNMSLMLTPIRDSHFTLIVDSAIYAKSRLYKFQLLPDQPFTYFRLGHIIEKGDLWIHASAMVIHGDSSVAST